MEVQGYLGSDDRLIVPLGSTEQHGTFGLFGTDHLISDRIARKVAEKCGIIAAPALPIGMSVHHMTFPGSLTLKPTTMLALLTDVLESLRSHGFRRVLLLNGHGGNRDIVRATLSQIINDMRDMRIYFRCWWEPEPVDEYIKSNFGEREGHHSSASETSIIMHLFPEHIKPVETPYNEMKRAPYYANMDTFRQYYPDGVMGADVSLASAGHGKRLFELCVSSFVEEIGSWEDA